MPGGRNASAFRKLNNTPSSGYVQVTACPKTAVSGCDRTNLLM
ncbi:hypothetical protein L21SP2_2598 [Salinispira pacifica]|uniref:Uncharacterized protein n=1 Tax=Salinispira pacifica TaxID=1307761 RepID=V5WJW2_9SPIO|nr:hypothetical protein L21SP2_2598 [Salinispira pacifica]